MAESSPVPRDKAELLTRIREARAALDRTVDRLGEAQLTTPGPDGWSGKDHLAHLAAWEGKIVAVMEGRPAHEGLGLDEAAYRGANIDEINAHLHERDRDRPLPDVLAAFRRTHGRLLTALEALPEAELTRPYESADAGDVLADGIAGNTYEHYEEHQATIEALAAQRR
jgi:uncharacterized protein (TIGR03083 family)